MPTRNNNKYEWFSEWVSDKNCAHHGIVREVVLRHHVGDNLFQLNLAVPLLQELFLLSVSLYSVSQHHWTKNLKKILLFFICLINSKPNYMIWLCWPTNILQEKKMSYKSDTFWFHYNIFQLANWPDSYLLSE